MNADSDVLRRNILYSYHNIKQNEHAQSGCEGVLFPSEEAYSLSGHLLLLLINLLIQHTCHFSHTQLRLISEAMGHFVLWENIL